MSLVQVQCCFASTETIRTIKDGEPRTATSTFTRSRALMLSVTSVLIIMQNRGYPGYPNLSQFNTEAHPFTLFYPTGSDLYNVRRCSHKARETLTSL